MYLGITTKPSDFSNDKNTNIRKGKSRRSPLCPLSADTAQGFLSSSFLLSGERKERVLKLKLALRGRLLTAHGVGLRGHGLDVLEELGQAVLRRLVVFQACGERVILKYCFIFPVKITHKIKNVISAVFRIRITDRIGSVDPDPNGPKKMFDEFFKVLKASPRA
jgi:hypothetical protein